MLPPSYRTRDPQQVRLANGQSVFLDADAYEGRLERLRSTPVDDLDADQRAELGAFELHERQRLAMVAAADADRPGAAETIDNDAAGYGQPAPQQQEPLTERSGWLTAPGNDPRLASSRSAAMKTLESYARSGELSAAAADRADGVLRHGDPDGLTARYVAAVGNENYLSAFCRMVGDPNMGHLQFSPAEVEAVREAGHALSAASRALSTGTTGVPLPFTLDPSIVLTGTGALNPIRDLANVITVGTHDWHGVTSDGVTAAYVAEAVEATDASPVLAGPVISTKQGRAFVPFSIELSQDWGTIQRELLGLVNDARNVLDAAMFLTGTGVNQPIGIFGGDATYSLGTAQRIQTTTIATYAVGDPWLLKAALPARFIATSTFAAAPGTWDTTYRFVAQGSTTEPRQFSDGDRGGDFLGRPKVEWSTMATGAATGTKLMVGGDWRTGYKIVDRLGMQAELIPHLFGATNRFPTGQRGLYCFWRTGAAVISVNAFRYLEVK